MDPDACLRRIEDAIQDDDYEEATTACLDLLHWISKGGFLPPNMSARLDAIQLGI